MMALVPLCWTLVRVTAAPLGIKSSLNQPAAGPRKDIFLCSAKEAKGIKKSHRDPRSLNCKVVGAVTSFCSGTRTWLQCAWPEHSGHNGKCCRYEAAAQCGHSPASFVPHLRSSLWICLISECAPLNVV